MRTLAPGIPGRFSFGRHLLGYFVEPETTTLKLDDYGFPGDWIEIKKELTYGESEALDARTLRPVVLEGESRPRLLPDQARMRIEYMLEYLVAWSFTNGGDPPKPVEISGDSVAALRKPVGNAIDLAIADYLRDGAPKNSPPATMTAHTKGSTRKSP